MGYAWSGRSVTGKGHRDALDSGNMVTSRIGVKADAGLPNGLRAGGVLERAVHFDTGEDSDGWNRQAFIFLSHEKYGKISFGNQRTAMYELLRDFDFFAQARSVSSVLTYKHQSNYKNMFLYTSPSWQGLNFKTGASFSTERDEAAGNNGDMRGIFFSPYYRGGFFRAAANVEYAKYKEEGGSFNGADVLSADLFARADAGAVKLAAGCGIRKASDHDFVHFFRITQPGDVYTPQGKDSAQFLFSAEVALGKKARLLATAVNRRTEVSSGGDDAKVWQYSGGGVWTAAKNLSFYAAYTYIKNNSAAKENPSLFSQAKTAKDYQSVFTAGVSFVFDVPVLSGQ